MQISSPRLVAPVWFTITLPKAAKGQGPDRANRALLASRIQWMRVLYGMELIDRPVPLSAVSKNGAVKSLSY